MSLPSTPLAKRWDEDTALLLPYGYTVERKTVGEGSYAVVKSALHQKLGQVAVKIVDKSNNAPKDFVNKFFPRELEILKKLNHPNIVRVHEIFEIGYKTFIVMELAERGDLLEYIKPKKYLTEHQSRFFFRQLVEAVSYLHGRYLIHRDLKCENILLDNCYNIKVTDFGFARVLLPEQQSKTFCGSAAYAAPEILRGEPYSGFAYDMWSLGVILYIMICGKMPFDDEDIQKQQAEQLARNIQYPSRLRLSLDVKYLIAHLLEPEISQRYNCDNILAARWVKKMPYLYLRNVEEARYVFEGQLSKIVRSNSPRLRDVEETDSVEAGLNAPQTSKNPLTRKLDKFTSIFKGQKDNKRKGR